MPCATLTDVRRLPLPVVVVTLCLLGCSATSQKLGGSASPRTIPAAATTPDTSTPPTATRVKPRPASSAQVSSTSSSVLAAPSVRASPTLRVSEQPSATHTVSPSTAVPTDAEPLIVLNPGHNGGDASDPAFMTRQVPAGFGAYKDCETTGTETNAGYPEHAYTWDTTLRLSRILRGHGVRVLLTRHNDHGLGPCVDKRAEIGNRRDVAAVVTIHGDGAPASGHGFFVMTAARQPAGATAQVARQSLRLADTVHDGLARYSGLTPSNYIGSNGYYTTTKFAALNLSTRPAVFLEIGNMRNASDAAVQSSAIGRQHIAEGLAAGILAFLGRP